MKTLQGGSDVSLSSDGNMLASRLGDGSIHLGDPTHGTTIKVWDLTQFNRLRKSRDYKLTQEEFEFLQDEQKKAAQEHCIIL